MTEPEPIAGHLCGVLIGDGPARCNRDPHDDGDHQWTMRRLRACLEAWPDALLDGEYNPSCCRFPKSCSADVYDPRYVTPSGVERGYPAPMSTDPDDLPDDGLDDVDAVPSGGLAERIAAAGTAEATVEDWLAATAVAFGLSAEAVLDEHRLVMERNALSQERADAHRLEREHPRADLLAQALANAEHDERVDGLTVVIAIGNTDNRLTQQEWAAFWTEVDMLVRSVAEEVHGGWVSPSTQPYQNAAWAIVGGSRFGKPWRGPDGIRMYLRAALSDTAGKYGQDSVAWVEARTQFIKGRGR